MCPSARMSTPIALSLRMSTPTSPSAWGTCARVTEACPWRNKSALLKSPRTEGIWVLGALVDRDCRTGLTGPAFPDRVVRRVLPNLQLRQQPYHPTSPFGCAAATEGTLPLWELLRVAQALPAPLPSPFPAWLACEVSVAILDQYKHDTM